MGKRRKGGSLPGMSEHGRTTPIWVFVLHLVVVFACTWGAMLAFSSGHRVVGVCLAGVWVVAFIITALDDVRIRAFEWTEVYVLVALDTLGVTGKTRGDSKSAQDKGVHSVSAEPPRSDLDVDQG